ncbi:hypothetical protein SUGI_0713520 [Cryptomeria japonica]|nr:hypothetical protein SUGI_0713520 [Cryptomeria japonica]
MSSPISLATLLTLLLFFLSITANDSVRKPYIVHMMKSVKPEHFSLHEHCYASILNQASFNVTFESQVEGRIESEYGHITWKCIQGGKHIVRSPISLIWIAL